MRIALLGDIALIGKYDRTTTHNVNHRVRIIRKLVQDCDYVIANLESPLTAKKKTHACKGIYIRSNPANVETLKYMGITHVTLANNHMFDYGKKGAEDTINALKHAGIKYVGLNGKPEMLLKGNDSAILDGFCCFSANALNYGKKAGQIKILSFENLVEFLALGEEMKCVPIASVHFGVEGIHYPSAEHINLFRYLTKDYHYILHGNHPHAIQGFERYNDSFLVYAQGNLCFDKTPVSSFKMRKSVYNNEEHKSFISIIDIKNNHIMNNQIIGLSDLDNGILREDSSVDEQLRIYASDMNMPIEFIQRQRNNELIQQREKIQKRNIRFFTDRINYKYIGAYINGRLHAKQYRSVFEEFEDIQRYNEKR